MLAGHDGRTGGQVAEQIRAAIADNCFLTSHGLAVRLTVSCGMATYPENAHDLVHLLGNADHALFETKGRGKNAVVACAEMKTAPQQDGFLPVDPH